MMGPWPLPFFHPFAPGWRHMSSVFRVSSEDVTMTGTCSKNRGGCVVKTATCSAEASKAM